MHPDCEIIVDIKTEFVFISVVPVTATVSHLALLVETLCVTLCPANIHKSVVPSPTANSTNVSSTFTDNLGGSLASSLVQHQTSQGSPLS